MNPFVLPWYFEFPLFSLYLALWFLFGTFVVGLFNNYVANDRLERVASDGGMFFGSLLWPAFVFIVVGMKSINGIIDLTVFVFKGLAPYLGRYWNWVEGRNG